MTKSRDLANAATALNAVTATEIGYVDGVTSAIQTQLNAKQAVVSGVNDTEIGYLDGVTSAIQTQLDAKTAKSTLTTTGDIYYASSANTPARLGIGSTGNVLTVASGIPSWAAPASSSLNLTLLSTTSASGNNLTINVSPYNCYVVVLKDLSSQDSNDMFTFRPNGNSTAANYKSQLHHIIKSIGQTIPAYTDIGTESLNGNSAFYYIAKKGNSSSSTNYVNGIITIWGGAGTGEKIFQYTTTTSNTNNYNGYGANGQGVWGNSATLTSLVFSVNNNFNGGTIDIYGGN